MDVTGENRETTLFTCYKTTAFISIEITTSEIIAEFSILMFCMLQCMGNFKAFLPFFNTIALRKAKIAYNLDVSEYNRVK